MYHTLNLLYNEHISHVYEVHLVGKCQLTSSDKNDLWSTLVLYCAKYDINVEISPNRKTYTNTHGITITGLLG